MRESVSVRRILGNVTVGLVIVGFAGLSSLNVPTALGAPNGEQIFKNNCACCHAGGGNIVNAKKPVKGSDKLASEAVFKAYLLKPTGAMSPFPKIANDAPALTALYNYCKKLK